jgi:ABC-2 type transport system permease protein
VLAASLYIIVCSASNRLRVRLRRLREPRYLIGAIVGAAYLYFSFFARFRATRTGSAGRTAGRTAPSILMVSAVREMAPPLIGIGLLAVAALGWLVPFDGGLLDFSPAEIQFLFPAPVSRRQLLLHRMMRSQLGLLFGGVIFGIALPSASGYMRVRFSIAMWLLLSIGKVYFTGISLARARLRSRDAHAGYPAWLPLAALAVALGIVGTTVFRAWMAQPAGDLQAVFAQVAAAATSGISGVVLWPFVAVVRPIFAEWPGPYLRAVAGAAVVLAACVTWVLKSDDAFQEAASEVVERTANNATAQTVTYRNRTNGWTLAATGRPEGAFAWKAAMQTLRLVDKRSVARIAAVVVGLTVAAASLGRANGLASMVAAFAMVGTAFSILMAPQILRADLRQDLQHLELLKTWPVRSSAVVRGELMWPGALLTAIAWVLLAVALLLSGQLLARVGLAWRMAAGAAIAIVAPALVFAQLTIHNGVALLFPAWVPLGNQRPRGLDAMGQRIIMLGGTWLLLAIMVLPAALAGAIVWIALGWFFGPLMLIPAASVGAAVVAIEVLLATEALGPAYERLDLTAVERAD